MTTKTLAPSPAAVALRILEHGDWRQRGLASQEMADHAIARPERVLLGAPGARARRDNGRFRSTRGDIAFAAA